MKLSCWFAVTMYSFTARAFLTRTAARHFGAQTCRATSSLSSTATATNPLLQMEGLPKFQSIEPKDLTPAVEELLAKMDKDFVTFEEKLASNQDVDYEQVLPEVERIQFGLGYVWGVAGHLNGVKNGEELREAFESNQPKIVEVMTRFSQSKPLYDALEKIEKAWEGAADIEFEESQKRRAVENSLRGMKLGGVGLEGEAKERFNEIKQRLAQISTTFNNNVLDETKAFSLTIEDASKLVGVPESAKAMWAAAHVAFLTAQGQEAHEMDPEMDPDKGPWRITLDMPSYIAVLSHVQDRGIREQVYKANISRASEKNEEKNNVPLIYEILMLRTEMAKLLGYKNYAELSLASKMAPSVESITELSDLIRDKALPSAEKEFAEITALAREKGGDEYGEIKCAKLMPWDLTFWSERLKESKFELTEEETRPYFALPAVLEGMFSLVCRIFNIEVKAADGETEVWNKDVQYFKVYDKETDKQLAAFFLDPYSRPEDKRGGAWMDVCIGKSQATNRDIPVAYLTCNGSPPVGNKPSLMTFREVETRRRLGQE
jgi:oligopeptidase A